MSEEDIKSLLYEVVTNDPVLSQINEIDTDEHSPVIEGEVPERIVIVLPGGIDNGQISRSFPRICICIPKIKCVKSDNTWYYRRHGKRLKKLSRYCIDQFRSGVYVKEHCCIYTLDTITTEDEPETWSSILNVRLRFEVVNTKL